MIDVYVSFCSIHVTQTESKARKILQAETKLQQQTKFFGTIVACTILALAAIGFALTATAVQSKHNFPRVSSFLVNENYVEPENIYEEVRENVYDTPSSFQPLSQMELATLCDFLDANFVNFAQQQQQPTQ